MDNYEIAAKNDALFQLCNRWLFLKNKGSSISDYLYRKGARTVAIYGMGELGKRLFEELDGSCVKVLFGIDQNSEMLDAPVAIYRLPDLNGNLLAVDAIVVTPVFYFEGIYKNLSEKYTGPILALNDILLDM